MERFERILNRYGERVTLTTGTQTGEIRAFIQPVLRDEEEAPFQVTSLGTADDRKWIYLGITPLEPGDRISSVAGQFRVDNSAAIYAGRLFSHWWAALSPEREAAE